jgi:hypothetical protein
MAPWALGVPEPMVQSRHPGIAVAGSCVLQFKLLLSFGSSTASSAASAQTATNAVTAKAFGVTSAEQHSWIACPTSRDPVFEGTLNAPRPVSKCHVVPVFRRGAGFGVPWRRSPRPLERGRSVRFHSRGSPNRWAYPRSLPSPSGQAMPHVSIGTGQGSGLSRILLSSTTTKRPAKSRPC